MEIIYKEDPYREEIAVKECLVSMFIKVHKAVGTTMFDGLIKEMNTALNIKPLPDRDYDTPEKGSYNFGALQKPNPPKFELEPIYEIS